MDQGFDLSAISKQMLSTVPLWLFAWAIFKSWLAKSKENKEMIEKQFKAQGEAMLAIHEKLNRIEINLASQGVDNLKSDLESLKKDSFKNEMKLEALFGILDKTGSLPKRASDLS